MCRTYLQAMVSVVPNAAAKSEVWTHLALLEVPMEVLSQRSVWYFFVVAAAKKCCTRTTQQTCSPIWNAITKTSMQTSAVRQEPPQRIEKRHVDL